jgi:hypothetical protein
MGCEWTLAKPSIVELSLHRKMGEGILRLKHPSEPRPAAQARLASSGTPFVGETLRKRGAMIGPRYAQVCQDARPNRSNVQGRGARTDC